MCNRTLIHLKKFQSTLPCWERRTTIITRSCTYGFQSTLPCWERRYQSHKSLGASSISIHAPVLGATFVSAPTLLTKDYFNPRSRAGSDEEQADLDFYFRISIHAPVLGATYLRLFCCFNAVLFQSTLPCWERLILG